MIPHPFPARNHNTQEDTMQTVSDAYDEGRLCGLRNLTPTPPADKDLAKAMMDGYADAQSEVLDMLMQRLLPRSARVAEGMS